jgi:hypothetical protein
MNLDPRQILDECRDKGQGTSATFPYESLFAIVDTLTKRILELEDTIDLEIAARATHDSYGRNEEAVKVQNEIASRRGLDWGGAMTSRGWTL